MAEKTWMDTTREILADYDIDPDAADAVVALYNIIRVAEAGVQGVPIGAAGIKIMLDLCHGLPNNEFWKRHASPLMADFTGRAFDWLRHIEVIRSKGNDVSKDPGLLQQMSTLRISFIALADYALRQTNLTSEDYMIQSAEMHRRLIDAGI